MKIIKLFLYSSCLLFSQLIFSMAPDTVVFVESTQPDWASGTNNSLIVSTDTLRLDTIRTYHFNFTNCGQTGRLGPSQASCNAAYTSTDLSGAVTVVDTGIQQWQTPEAGIYRILAAGAGHNSDTFGFIRGAILRADFELAKSTGLKVLVGQMGAATRGGNGGTFVTYLDTTPLIIAGGAGGMRSYVDAGNRGSTSTSGQSVTGPGCSAVGGTAGGGGQALGGGTCSGAGAGLYGDGQGCGGGFAFIHGGGGGANVSYLGGFGGGGGVNSASSPGGGGGYSGGSVHYTGGGSSCAGGGGSFIAANGDNVITSDGHYDGNSIFNGDSIKSFNDWRIGHGIVAIESSKYVTTGDRISPVHDISTPATTLSSSEVAWHADIFTGNSLLVETRYSTNSGNTWSSWNTATNGGPIPGLSPGTAMDSSRLQTRMTLSTTASFASPQVYSLSVTVINDSLPTGITKYPNRLERLRIYPNPFENTIKVGYTLSRPSNVGLRFYSMLGKSVIIQENTLQSAGQHSLDVNTVNLQLSPGLYWVEILIDGQAYREKLIRY